GPRYLDNLRPVKENYLVILVDESRFEALVDKKKSKVRLHKWLKFLKDYNFDLSHHLGKVNIVVNALNEKFLYMYNGYRDLKDSSLVCEVTLKSIKLDMLKVTSGLMKESREGQKLSNPKEKLTTHYLEETTRIHGVPLSKTRVYLKILRELPGALETKVKIDYKLPYVIRQLS
ncbi:hypothetical protein CR513_43733, partial [Mucuna pruriens]